jgi:hypothetical protein
MGGCGGVWMTEPTDARNIGGQFENARVVYLINHGCGLTLLPCLPI